MQRRAKWSLRIAMVCALAGAGVAVVARQPASRAPAVDVFVFDADGRPVTTLGAGQFAVTVDGAPRGVRAARYVYRGPGAEAAARGAAHSADAAAAPLFEPRRLILVVVDETSFPRGAEKTVTAATDRLLDRFGPGDHVALVTIPLPPDSLALSFGDDRSSIRDTLARIVGRGTAVDLLAGANDVRPDVPAAAASSSASSAEAGAAARPAEKVREEEVSARGPDSGPGLRGDRTLDVVARLLGGLRVAPGPKTVILVSAGLAEADRPAAPVFRSQVQAVAAAAVASRSALYVLGLPSLGGSESWNDLEQLGLATGGGLVRAGRNVDQALDRVGFALAGLYHLELEPAATDGDGKPHAIKVTVARPSVTVRAARDLVPRDDPPFFAVAPLPPAETPSPDQPAQPAAARDAGAARRAESAPDPETDTVVARAAEYVGRYFREFRDVVAEEDYVQTVSSPRPAERREMKSDFLLVTTADGRTWVPFRDVFEVDGRAVRDRDDRLRKLFLESPPGTAFEAMARVQDEGARYNLVRLGKTNINVPTFALTILLEGNLRSFSFRRGREETVDGLRLLRVDFDETATPTLIRSADAGDIPSSGSFWIDPLSGRVVKSLLRGVMDSGASELVGLTLESTVVYHRSDTLGLWVPADMRETYRLGGYTIEGHASYSRFRSFQVKTEQEIKVVKHD